MRWSPAVTVAAVIPDQDSYLVVEEGANGHTVINQPAGHLEPGESLIEAVCREVLEETCCRFEPTGVVGIYQWTVPDSGHQYLRVCFVGEVGPPDPSAQRDPDILATHWLSYEQIVAGPPPPRSPMVTRCLDDHRRGPASPVELLRLLD